MMHEEDLSQRPSDDDPLVVYLVVRASLGMSAGKVGAQCGHAVQMLVRAFAALEARERAGDPLEPLERDRLDTTRAWLGGIYRKVVLGADDHAWERLKREVDGFLVHDVGLTEVASGAETAIALWPVRRSEAPRCVRRLRLL